MTQAQGAQVQGTQTQLTLYSKPDCLLCDELKDDLASLRDEFPFALREVNILEDETLFAQFRYLIPVLQIGETQLFYPPHDWLTLRNALAAAQG